MREEKKQAYLDLSHEKSDLQGRVHKIKECFLYI